MKFTQLTNEVFGAQNAGFRIDPDAERMTDDERIKVLHDRMGETYVNALLDSFYDFESDLFQGEDGEYYAVMMDPTTTESCPLILQRLLRD